MHMFAGSPTSNVINVSICPSSTGEEYKHQLFLSLVFSNNCTSPTALANGVGQSLTNAGVAPAGGNFTSFVPALGTPNVQYFSVNAGFFGANNAIGVDIVPGSAPAISNYQVWIMSNCDGTSGTLPATDITNACFATLPGNYIIVVASEAANAGNFTITANALATPPSNISVAETSGNTNNDGQVCEGDDFTISTTSNVTYTYAWQRGATNLPNTTFDLAVVNSTTTNAGLYSVTITDNNGCSTVVTQNIVVYTLPTVNLSVSETSGNANNDGQVCVGNPFTLTATAGGATYAWTLNGSPITGSTNTITVASASAANGGLYEVTYEDANGCFDTDNLTITVNTNPTASNTELKECGNGSTTASFTLTDAELTPNFPAVNSNSGADIDNGVGGLTVTYHTTLANANNNTGALSSPYSASNGTIVFARLENANGCYVTAQVTLTVTVNPTDLQIQNVNNANSPTDFIVCQGLPISLTAFVSTGLAPYTYAWTRPNATTSTGINQIVAAASPAIHSGIWSVTVTDANGCTDTDDINITVIPNPVNDACAGALPLVTSNNAGLTNDCATQDNTPCTGTINEASVWYNYTIPVGVKTLTFTSSSPNHFIKIYQNDCSTAISGACANMVTLNCPAPQTVKVFVSSTTANDGIFSLNIASVATTAVNDLCANATVIPSTPSCQFLPAPVTTTVGACPESFTVAGCALNYSNEDVVWYQFTTPAGTVSVDFNSITANAYLSIFPSCASTTPIASGGCISGSTSSSIPVSANTTYFIAIGISGSTGAVGFNIKYNTPPANDACANAIAVVTGNNAGLTNDCATQDLTPCAGAINEASVWYSYTIPANVKTLTLTSSSSNHFIKVYGNNCSTAISGACDNTVTLDCPLAQTIKIFVSSSSANDGPFSLNITSTATTATNDLCTNAQVIAASPTCQFFAAPASTTVGACPETFTVAGCAMDYSTEDVVWYQFTTPASTTSVEFNNITANAYLTLFTSCPAAAIVPGGGCIAGSTTTPITVTANTTYYIAIGLNGSNGSVGFNIKYNTPPANDACANSIAVNTGANNGLTNACATQDLTPCAGTENEASVWYDYVIGPGVKQLTFTASGTNHKIRLYESDCATPVAGTACNNPVLLDCPLPRTIKIFVSSTALNAGTFSLTINQTLTTAANDLCTNATDITDPTICKFFPVPGSTTVGACPETFTLAGCGLNYSTDAIVWYKFTTPTGTTSINVSGILGTLSIFSSCPAVGGSIPGGGCLSGSPAGNITVSANTTYYVAIGLPGATGNVGFNLKYNVALVNDNPCIGGFTATTLTGTLTGQDNTCATSDNNCGGNLINKTLWYTVTIAAPNDKLNITVTGLTNPSIGLYASGNPCNATVIDEECSGDGIKDFNCLQPGIYNVMIGTSTANAGVFSVTATPGVNVTVANDLCVNATVLPVLPTDICVNLGPFTTTNVNACPENIAGAGAPCNFNAEEVVWVSFTAPGTAGQNPTMDFRFTSYSGTGTPFMGLFTSCTTPLGGSGCRSGNNIVFGNMGPLTAGTTYYIAIGSTGDSGGTFNFEIKFNIGPPNDDPCAAGVPDVSAGGTFTGTTSCAGGDPTLPQCPTVDQQNVVFFKFTVTTNSKGINVSITPSGTPPFSGGIVAGVVQNACPGPGTVLQAACGSGSLSKVFECLPPGDYFLQISTSGATAGDFTLTVTPIANNAPVNDVCGKASDINLVNCDWVTATGTTVNACPELFSSGGCAHNNDPTVWMQFTTPPGATEIDFRNIPAGTYVTMMTSCTGTTYIACSNDTNPFENIAVMGNTTYYLAVASTNPAGTPFTFDVRVIVPPANDCTPEVIASGGSATLTSTCCATNPGDPGACPAPNQQATVWYEYQPDPAAKAVKVVFSAGSMTGFIAEEIFTGAPGQSCNGGFAPVAAAGNPYCIAAGSNTVTVKCEDFSTTSIYVKVGSSDAGCGTFSLSFIEENGCQGAETCADIVDLMEPITDGPAVCVNSCNNFNCSEGGDCDPNGASVWFQVHPQLTASSMIIQINGATFSPIMTVYSGADCSTIGSTVACDPGSILTLGVNAAADVFIKVEAAGGLNLGNFEICVSTLFATFDCYESETVTTRPEYPTANPNGPFCPGETVNFCHRIDFTVAGAPPPAGNTCQWIQGIIPTFGDGWDVLASPIAGQGPAGWNWLAENNVDYNFPNSQYQLYTLPTGELGLKYNIGGGNLQAGSGLPGGWWFTSNGGAGCANNGDPDTMWGLPGPGCNTVQVIQFCFNMKVKELVDLPNCAAADLGYTIFAFADGETGCWTNLSCALSVPYLFAGDIDCSANIQVSGPDKQICSGFPVLIQVAANAPNAIITLNTIDNPNVTGETLTGSWPNSIASFTDILTNTGTNVEVVTYVFQAKGVNSICLGPPFELKVTVYPNLEVLFPPVYVCDGLCTSISPNVSGGSGIYTNYLWSTGATTSAITVCPTLPTTYKVTVTDDKGCMGTGEVEVDWKPPVAGELDPNPLSICKDGIDDPGPYIVVNMTSGNDPYVYTWNFPGGIFGTQGTTNYDGDTYDIDEENSIASAIPRNYSVNIVDVFGCQTTINGELSIDGAPEVTFTYPPVACGQNTVVLKATFDFGQSSSGLDKFELYDCNENLIATKNNNPSFFTIADLSANNCFVLKTITTNGCIDTKTLTVVPPVGTQAIVSGTSPICKGQNSTISVTNVAAFVNPTFLWSNGLPGPNITVGPLVTTTYVVTVTEPSTGCTDEANFEVIVNQKPIIDIIGSTTFCAGSSTTIQANSNIAGSTFVWSGAGTSTTNTVLINTAGPLTVTVTSPAGCIKDTTFNVSSSTSLTVNLNDLALCNNAVDTLTPGSFFNTYKWAKDGVDITGQTSSKLPVNSVGLYTVTVSDIGGCTGIGTKNVTNSPSPNANVLINPVDVCRVNSGVGPTFIDFTTLVSGSPGKWIEILHPGNAGFSTVSLSTLSNVSFLGQDRDTFRFQYVTNTAIAPCENDTVFVDVMVNNCPCPSINFEPAEVCNDETKPVDLNLYLKVPTFIRDGKWSVTGGPGTANITNDTLMNVNGIAAGVYNLNWVTNVSIGACPNSGAHTLTVNDAPTAKIKGNRFVCNASTSLGASSIDLDTILVSGTNPGTWVQISGTPVTLGTGNILDGIGLTPEVLSFEYTTNNAVAPCKDAKVKLNITVRDCNCPIAIIEMDTLCNGSGNVNLNTLITVDPVGTPGTWTSTAVGAVTGSTFNATGITSGSYKIRFTLNNDPGGSCAKFFEQDIIIRRQPVAENNIDGSPCNVTSSTGATTVNLFSLLKPGYTPGGTWTQLTGPSPFTIPANGVIDFNGLNIGDTYTFKYDLSAIDPCVPVSVTVKAVIKDCNCPNVVLLPPATICNTEFVYDLSLLQDAAIAPGVWTVIDPLGVSLTVTGNKTFDVQANGTGIIPGNYKLRYTLQPVPAGTCPKFTEVVLTVIKEETANIKPSETVCNVDKGNNDTRLDFRNFFGAGSFGGGTWTKPANFPGPFNDFTSVDFTGLPVGSKYTFTYAINNALPCEDHQYQIVIEVIDCKCPPIKPLQPKDVCASAGTLDLVQYNDPLNPGDWSSTELVITNNKADLSNLVSGNYKLKYKIKNPLPNCPDSINLVLTVVKPKNIGTATPKDVCSNEPESIKLGDLIAGEDTGGSWKEVSLKPSTASSFNAAAGTFNTTNQAAGTYVFEYLFTNQTPCPDSKQTVTINVISAPTAQGGNPATIDCKVAEVTIGDPTDNQPNVTYEWTHDGGQIVPNGDKATTKVNFGGKFTIKVTNTITGCSSTDDVLVTVDPNKPVAEIDAKNVSCFNAKDGSITFVNIKGGQLPLQFSNNGGTSFQATPSFNGLSGGTYKMIIKDATGCTFIQDVELTEPNPFSINIGNDTIITLGASVSMNLVNQIKAGAKNITWTASDTSGVKTICDKPLDQCIELSVSPTITTTYCAKAVDNNGCIAEDCRTIILLKARNIVFSNILRPGIGGENETFYPESNSVGWINKMSVYDRWGNLMFTRSDFAANDPSLGWNGTFNGKDVVPGVYTWIVELEYDKKGSGELELFKGDVTVIR